MVSFLAGAGISLVVSAAKWVWSDTDNGERHQEYLRKVVYNLTDVVNHQSK